MTRLLLVSFLFLPGCFLALDLSHGGKGNGDELDSDVDTGLVIAPDTDTPPVASLQLSLDPNTVSPGEQALLVATLTGDASTIDVTGIDLGPDVLITATRVLDADELAISVDVSETADLGPVDVVLDVDGLGTLVFPDALEIAAP